VITPTATQCEPDEAAGPLRPLRPLAADGGAVTGNPLTLCDDYRVFWLWRGKGTASPVELAGQMMKILARAFPGRAVHGTGDAAFHGEPLAVAGTTWTTRLPANAALYGPKPPRTGKRGRPRVKGHRLGTCAQIAASAAWADTVINAYGHDTAVQVADAEALWHGSFSTVPGRAVLIRAAGSPKDYDLGLFTLDTEGSVGCRGSLDEGRRWPTRPRR
jgi:hypothetical protein